MRALALALLLPFVLAACGEAEEEKEEPARQSNAVDQRGGEDSGELAEMSDDLPLIDLDSDEFAPPDAILPLEAGRAPDPDMDPDLNPGAEGTAAAPENTLKEPENAPPADLPGDMPFALPEAPSRPAATTTRVRALDKITARVIELDLPQDTEVRFGTLAIRARTCRARPPEEPPETFAFLEIDDVKMNGERERVFSGWMMASSPALNALEHPVYDVWVIACRRSSAAASSASE